MNITILAGNNLLFHLIYCTKLFPFNIRVISIRPYFNKGHISHTFTFIIIGSKTI